MLCFQNITYLTEDSFSDQRKQEVIAVELALDGVYIIRTPVAEDVLKTAEIVSYN